MRMFWRLLQTGTPAPLKDEVLLLAESRRRYPNETLTSLTRTRLQSIAQQAHIDVATALLYHHVRTTYAPFIQAVNRVEVEMERLSRLPYKVWIAPAGFYEQFPMFGGDGGYIAEIARRFGAEAAPFPIPGGASVAEGAAIIREVLAQEAPRSVLLVSLSKGGTDARMALLESERVADKVAVWLQICGLVQGFHYGSYLMEGRWGWFWKSVGQAFLTVAKAKRELFDELLTIGNRPVPAIPSHLQIVNVLGFPLTTHLRGTIRSRHRELSVWGPNDGYGLTRDAMLEPGVVYPVWGADHYFRFPGMTTLLYQLFSVLSTDTPLPGMKPL